MKTWSLEFGHHLPHFHQKIFAKFEIIHTFALTTSILYSLVPTLLGNINILCNQDRDRGG